MGRTRTIQGHLLIVWKDELFSPSEQHVSEVTVEPDYRLYACETTLTAGRDFETDLFDLLDERHTDFDLVAEGVSVLKILGLSESELKQHYDGIPVLTVDEIIFDSFREPFVVEKLKEDKSSPDGYREILFFYLPNSGFK